MRIPWPIEKPQLIYDQRLYRAVANLEHMPRPIPASHLIQQAYEIFKQYPPTGEIRQQLQQLLNLVNTIGNITYEITSDSDGPPIVINHLCKALARLYAVYMTKNIYIVPDIYRLIQILGQHPHYRWLCPKLLAFLHAYRIMMQTQQIIREHMPEDPSVTSHLADLGIHDDQAIEKLATSIATHRAYDIKPCMFQDGIMHGDKDVWTFNGLDEFHESVAPYHDVTMVNPLALTLLAPRQQVKQIRPTRAQSERAGIEFSYEVRMVAIIQPSGELTYDVELGAIPLKAVFKQAGRPGAYRLFQVVHLMRLYNLVVPRYVGPKLEVPDWPVLPTGNKARRAHRQALQTGFRTLVLPRLRVLRDPDAITSALNRELTEGAAETQRLATKKARHYVPGFTRPLPPGCLATDRAQQLARDECGIILPPGYTYVRNHHRGSGPNPAPEHTVKLRPNAIPPQLD